MKTSKHPHRIFFAGAAVVATISVGAHAEYRCKAPPTAEDKVACDLAKLGRPDELRLFVERTGAIYGLYFYDYVSQEDIDRWDSPRQENARPITTADDRAQGKSR